MDDLHIRCFCSRQPLLAMAGRDAKGNGFVHVKTWKGGRLYAEVVITAGEAYITCRECLRRHRVRIVHSQVETKQHELPETIAI